MLRSQGVDAAWAVRHGRAADEILAAADESGADLIAMATHGRTGIGRLLFGSVAEAVLRRAPVPVFMIREPHTVEAAPAAREGSVR
jgi:nucleotide-binding universal stress UspA family protein